MDTKKCLDCKEELTKTEFSVLKKGNRKWLSSYCKKCMSLRTKESVLKRKYGVTPEEVKKMFDNQNGKCAICETALLEGRGTHIDHCHTSGKIGKLLCLSCNVGLGQFKDDIKLFRKAIEYLENNR